MKFTLKPNIKKLQLRHILFIVIALIVALLLTGLVLSLLQKDPQDKSGNLYYLTSQSSKAGKDSDITYSIRFSPGEPVDTVTASLDYDPNKLTYKSVSYEDSPFNTQIPEIKETGSITIQSAQFNGNITQDSFVASIVFTPLGHVLPSDVKLSGNAAHAGIATNPTINQPDGVSSKSSQRAAPWLIGLILCLFVSVGFAIFLIIRRRKHKLHNNNHKKTQDNTGNTDEAA